jgi:hypothetical protein
VLRPRQLDDLAVRRRPQAAEAVEALERFGEAHVGELLHRARRQPVTAGLLAWERPLLDDEDVVALLGQPVRGRRARGTAPDDEHLAPPAHRGCAPATVG